MQLVVRGPMLAMCHAELVPMKRSLRAGMHAQPMWLLVWLPQILLMMQRGKTVWPATMGL